VDATHHGAANKTSTREFLSQLPHRQPGPQLAMIYQASLDGHVAASDIMTHFLEQGTKYSFYEDLRPYLAYLSNSDAQSLIQSLEKFAKSTDPLTPTNVFEHLNAIKLQATLKAQLDSQDLPDEDWLLKEYHRLLPMGAELKETERQYPDDLLLLACQSRLSAGKTADDLLQIAAWLEEGLVHSKHNYQFKLLLARVYLCLGCGTRALKLIESLNFRTVQFDSIGYFLTEPMDSLAMPDDSLQYFARLSSIYFSNLHETPEMISMAYENGSLSKVPEFVEFYQRLQDSLSRSLLLVARRRVDIWKGLSDGEGGQIWNPNDDALLQDAHLATARDNRDFVVMGNLLAGAADSMEERSRVWPRRNDGWIKTMHLVQSVVRGRALNDLDAHLANASECTDAERTSLNVLLALTRLKNDATQIKVADAGLTKLRTQFEALTKDGRLSWEALNTLTSLVEALCYPVALHGKKKGKPDALFKQHAASVLQLVQSLSKQLPISYSSEKAQVCSAYQLHVLPDWKAALQRCTSKLASMY